MPVFELLSDSLLGDNDGEEQRRALIALLTDLTLFAADATMDIPALTRQVCTDQTLTRATETIHFGLLVQSGKVSGSEVAEIPDTIANSTNIHATLTSTLMMAHEPNAICIETFPEGRWFLPRKEPKEVEGPVVYVPIEGNACFDVGGNDLSPRGKGVFGNVRETVTVPLGSCYVFPNDNNNHVKVGMRPVDGAPLRLACLRYVDKVPRSVLLRRTKAERDRLTAVVPVTMGQLQPPQPPTPSHTNSIATTCSSTHNNGNDDDNNDDDNGCVEREGSNPPREGGGVHRVKDVLVAPDIEKKHVVDVYDTIASHWDRTRHKPWPKVVEFLRSLEKGSLVADVGCGNGKYLAVRKDIVVLGSDRSTNLCEVCAQHGFEVSLCDCLLLPYRLGVFDAVISIAVMHHLSTPQRRLHAIAQMAALLRPGGKLLVQAWALEQEEESKRSFPTQDVFVPWLHLEPESEVGVVSNGSTIAPTQQAKHIGLADSNPVYQRYCHVFREGELQKLIEMCGLVVDDSYYDRSNWCVTAHKPPAH